MTLTFPKRRYSKVNESMLMILLKKHSQNVSLLLTRSNAWCESSLQHKISKPLCA